MYNKCKCIYTHFAIQSFMQPNQHAMHKNSRIRALGKALPRQLKKNCVLVRVSRFQGSEKINEGKHETKISSGSTQNRLRRTDKASCAFPIESTACAKLARETHCKSDNLYPLNQRYTPAPGTKTRSSCQCDANQNMQKVRYFEGKF